MVQRTEATDFMRSCIPHTRGDKTNVIGATNSKVEPMEFKASSLFCSKRLIDPLDEVQEIYHATRSVIWRTEKPIAVTITGKQVFWQEAYNRLFEIEFEKIGGWKASPILCDKPRHKGDFAKKDGFVEIQFGNSATLYRDYYKFHYGLVNKLLSLSVLLVPTNPINFFPARDPSSIRNMASYEYALEHFSALTIPVPLLLIGLLPLNDRPHSSGE
jgi:hypothetical protein